MELSFVDAMFEMWKLRWTILRARHELIAKGVLKKYKHLDGSYIFEKSSHWRSDALENMIKKYNEERDRKIAQEGSLLLYKSYFLQYNALLLNCEKQYLKFVNLDVYKIIEKI